jgi:aryl-alcohol dehydrogenase-like predicted oxidoreductase
LAGAGRKYGLMRYRQLGNSGLTVSVVGLGCNNFGGRCDLEQSRAVVDAALDAGVNLLDTSNTYGNKGGSETALGEILRGRRDQVVLATKFGSDMGDGPGVARGSRRYVRRAVDASLGRLQTDRIDLYQLHKPDPLTPLEETLAALDELVKEGKVLYIGSSNLAAWQVAHADWVAATAHSERFVSAQNHLSLLAMDAAGELLPACRRYGVGVLPYFPLANGLLTGKYRRSQPAPEGTRLAGQEISDSTYDTVEALESFAKERGHSLLELAIGALAAMEPVASVIAGATRPEQVNANVAAGEWEMGADDLGALRELLGGG